MGIDGRWGDGSEIWVCEQCGTRLESLTKTVIKHTYYEGMRINHLLCEECSSTFEAKE